MQKLKDINEVTNYLKQGEIVTNNGKNQFILKNKKIYCYNDGTHYNLDLKDFVELYHNETFYLYEEEVLVDDKKDEEYYRYYRK